MRSRITHLPAQWNRARLGEVASINPESLGAGIPFDFKFGYIDITAVSQGEISWSVVTEHAFGTSPSRARRRVQEGDLLFGTVRPANRSHGYVPQRIGELVASTGFAVVRPYRSISDPRFLLHLILGSDIGTQARQAEVGSNYPAVNERDLARFEVSLPPLPEQRRIAEILDTLDEAIRKTEQVIAKLQQMKQGLLHDLLTRGIDDNGELRDPDRHPEQFKDSPLGRIPSGWRVYQLADLAEFITSGSRGWAAFYSDTGPLFLRIANLTREHINLRFASMVHVRPPQGSEGKRTAVREGDLLISITADLGIIGVVPSGLGEAYVNQHVALTRLDKVRADARWLGHYLAGRAGQQQFDRLNDQGAKSGLNLGAVGWLHVSLPVMTEQVHLASILDDHDALIRQEQVNAEKLRTLKHGLMDDLLTGGVRVSVPEDAAA